MKELSLEEAALAWAQGKMVEAARHDRDDEWIEIDGVGKCEQGTLGQQVFGLPDLFRFRLATEPPAKKFKPLTVEEWEGRLGATVRKKGAPREVRLVGSCVDGVITIAGGWQFTPQAILDGWEFGDGSPCGVEVDA